MVKIFSDPSRPFYQISQPMQLGYIPRESYGPYILGKLNKWTSIILESQKHFFLAQKNLLTTIQWKTLKAISKMGEVRNLSSNEFLTFSGLAQTSARRSVEVLLERGMLLEESGAIKVYNVFLSRYLEFLE